VGSYPAGPEDYAHLKDACGVRAVLSVQTDDDLKMWGLSPGAAWRLAMASGLAVERVPIVDFREDALKAGLVGALGVLHALVEEEGVVYLHCTAGVNRSPTLALAYLMLREGWSAAEALERGREARPQIDPYPAVLRWVERERARLWPAVTEAAEQG